MKERSTWFALVRRCLIPALFAVAVLLFTSGRVHAADEETQTAGEAEQEITQESVSVDDADAVQNVASETADDEAAVLADDSSNAQIADDSDEELPGGGV